MNNQFDLSNKIAIITGGSRGLGYAIAEGLANAGAQVAIIARQPPQSPGFKHEFYNADLVNPSERSGLIERIATDMGAVDILFHCAGQQHRAPAMEFPQQEWNDILELHLNAAMDLGSQAARIMSQRGGGKIVLTSSILGFQGGLYIPAYAAAKHAINGLVKALCNEWAPHGINVNALAPGYFQAGVGQAVLDDPVRGPQIISRIPAGRAGSPDELTGAAVFLASAASNYVHGHTLVVDGGWLAR